MNYFKVKLNRLSGSDYGELRKKANLILGEIKRHTKRRSYVRCAYFGKSKIFFDYFWPHLFEKNYSDRIRRLKYLPCALELIKKSKEKPIIYQTQERRNEILYRFMGETGNKELFLVQIKENKKTGQKYFMSCFPEK
jgi:hypothetical protein